MFMYEEVVIDSAGQKLAYVYFEDEPGRRIGREIWRYFIPRVAIDY